MVRVHICNECVDVHPYVDIMFVILLIVHGRAGVSFGDAASTSSESNGWRRVYANASSLSWHYCPTHPPIVIDIPIAVLARR